MSKQQILDREYVCPTVCAECPFRVTGSSAVRITRQSAERISRDLLNDKPFPCHLTSTPNGLGTPAADKSEWRMCAGAYASMSPEERDQNLTLRQATKAGLHDRDFEPKGAQLCFKSLDEFCQYYQDLSE